MNHSLMLLDGLKLCVFKTFYENVYFVAFHAHGMHLWQIQLFECDFRMSLEIHSELLFLQVKRITVYHILHSMFRKLFEKWVCLNNASSKVKVCDMWIVLPIAGERTMQWQCHWVDCFSYEEQHRQNCYLLEGKKQNSRKENALCCVCFVSSASLAYYKTWNLF